MPSSPSLAAQPGAGEPEPEPTADSKGRPFMCARSCAAPPLAEARFPDQRVHSRRSSRAALAKHDQREDVWMTIHNKVYDITKYLDDHPGGEEVLMDRAGQDGTEDFEDVGHSKDARDQLHKYELGELPPSEQKAERSADAIRDASGGGTMMMIMPIIGLVAAAAYYYLFMSDEEEAEAPAQEVAAAAQEVATAAAGAAAAAMSAE